MVTKHIDYDGSVSYMCLSTDSKPVGNTNDLLLELDTKKVYYSGTESWVEVGEEEYEGGGGGK